MSWQIQRPRQKKKISYSVILTKLQALCVLLRKEAFKGDLFWFLPARYIYSWTKVALYDSQLGATPLFIYTCQLPSSSLKPNFFLIGFPSSTQNSNKEVSPYTLHKFLWSIEFFCKLKIQFLVWLMMCLSRITMQDIAQAKSLEVRDLAQNLIENEKMIRFFKYKQHRWQYLNGQLHVWQNYIHSKWIFIIGQTTGPRVCGSSWWYSLRTVRGLDCWASVKCQSQTAPLHPEGSEGAGLCSPAERASKTIWQDFSSPGLCSAAVDAHERDYSSVKPAALSSETITSSEITHADWVLLNFWGIFFVMQRNSHTADVVTLHRPTEI